MTLGYIQDDGIKDFLTDLIAGTNFLGMRCRLYNASETINDSTTFATLTAVEGGWTGYAAVHLGGWSAASVTAHVASTISATATFTLTAGTGTVWGAFLTDSGNTKLYGAQQDPNAPVTLNTTVSVYQVTVTITNQSLN